MKIYDTLICSKIKEAAAAVAQQPRDIKRNRVALQPKAKRENFIITAGDLVAGMNKRKNAIIHIYVLREVRSEGFRDKGPAQEGPKRRHE
ncbi:hypothetical protein CDAR_264331 [Caerostris darwini]|uniref:Uncharacterized protein n=1 Tax=Caerostris darwini TaxID=1538125 RepID=A0AAV4RFN9_9ARAC|nr:hypothetical protein CDAR_264331 [Caerostris darwini]